MDFRQPNDDSESVEATCVVLKTGECRFELIKMVPDLNPLHLDPIVTKKTKLISIPPMVKELVDDGRLVNTENFCGNATFTGCSTALW